MENGPRWPTWLATAPRLLAESLGAVRDPLSSWLHPGPAAGAPEVAAALAQAMLPPAADETAPAWLRPDQGLSFRRALAAVRSYRGALLADGVGSGKTWIALAVAHRLAPTRPAIVVAPATLRAQWREVAARAGVRILFHSHEAASRGRAPPPDCGVVIVDESHHLRHPDTHRYAVLARWCSGRRGLLLSATPAVNRLADVAHQLRLLVRDDALAWSGVTSLGAALLERAPGSLCHLLVTGEDRSDSLPSRRGRTVCAEEPRGGLQEHLLSGIARLALSRDRAIAELIRVSLLLALASSPAAIAAALRRYRLLLLHARDATLTGTPVTRGAIRRMVGSLTDQLVLWPLAGQGAPVGELDLDDVEPAGRLERLARDWSGHPDAKVTALRDAVADGRPSLVFTTAIATVEFVRRHLERRGVAWCTGRRAGLDQAGTERESVLDWFRRADAWPHPSMPPPGVLITTDVAAEGLDLRLVERVVHYDLPWTAVRLEQRAGRALRLGGAQREVELVRFAPPPAIRAALEQERILERKADLPGFLGLGPGEDAPWRIRAQVAGQWESHRAVEGVASIDGPVAGVAAGYRLRLADGTARNVVLARGADGWSDDPALVARVLESCRTGDAWPRRAPVELSRILRRLVPAIRNSLREANAGSLGVRRATPAVRLARRQLLQLAREAARTRQSHQLEQIERGLGLLRQGLTAGEALAIAEWERLPELALLAMLSRMPRAETAPAVTGVELIGVLAVEPGGRCR